MLENNNQALKFTLISMLVGMILISVPNYFYVNSFVGALIWIPILSMIECIVSYLDVQGARTGCLFVKELSIGVVGSALCVLSTRCVPLVFSGISLGFLGIIAVATATILLYDDCKRTI